MNLLSIDSSSPYLSLATVRNTLPVNHASYLLMQRFTEQALPLVVQFCTQPTINKFDLIVYGTGPGSFTSIRIGAAIALAMALNHACPVAGVSSLQTYALQAHQAWLNAHISIEPIKYFYTCLPAGKNRYYYGTSQIDVTGKIMYEDECLLTDVAILPVPATPASSNRPWIACGGGWQKRANTNETIDWSGCQWCLLDTHPHAQIAAQIALQQNQQHCATNMCPNKLLASASVMVNSFST